MKKLTAIVMAILLVLFTATVHAAIAYSVTDIAEHTFILVVQ
jgi:archaellum component FlaG (FlaF/FlaG flagellin family)